MPHSHEPKPGWVIVGRAFLEAPGRHLTNIELGALPGVQAFRSRIADLRRMGWPISAGAYVKRGVYAYQLDRGWQPPYGWMLAHPPEHGDAEDAEDLAVEGALFDDASFSPPPASAIDA